MLRIVLPALGLIATLTAILLLLVTPAKALESRDLAQHGAWTVSIDIYDDGSLHCAMSTANDIASMVISVDSEDTYSVFGMVDGLHAYTDLIDLHIRIDTETWEFRDVNASNVDGRVFWATVMEQGKGFQFRQDIMQGRMLWLDRTNSNVPFSLRGSAAAMLDLDKCRRMIRPNI